MKTRELKVGNLTLDVVTADNTDLEFDLYGMGTRCLPIETLIADLKKHDLASNCGAVVISKIPDNDYEGYYNGVWGGLIYNGSDVVDRLITGCLSGDVDMLEGLLTAEDVPHIHWRYDEQRIYAVLVDVSNQAPVKFYWVVIGLYE